MSVIMKVYSALEAKSVTTASGKTPIVYGLNELPENITTSQLPCRLLLPVGGTPGEGRDLSFIAIGTGVTVNWQITDLMLWQASEQGIGPVSYTHLRAHDTPEHLVCRPLLDKKKLTTRRTLTLV